MEESAEGSKLWCGAAVVVAVCGSRRGRRAAASGVAALAVAQLVSNGLCKQMADRTRPPKEWFPHDEVEDRPQSSSFPSGHTAAAVALTAAVAPTWPLGGALCAVPAAMVAVERVQSGAHYPSDVVTGALIGLASAWLTRHAPHLLLQCDCVAASTHAVQAAEAVTPDPSGPWRSSGHGNRWGRLKIAFRNDRTTEKTVPEREVTRTKRWNGPMTRQEPRRLGPEAVAEHSSPTELDQEAEEVTLSVMAASRLLVAISARALASTDVTLTLPQLRALVVLDACGPVKLAAMAATLGVNPSTALRMVERLESAGHMDRKTNPDNRREVILRLTPVGRDLVERVLAHRRTEIRALVQRLPAEARAALVPALRALTEAADDMAVDALDEVRRVGGLIDDPLNPAPAAAPQGGRRRRPKGGTV